MNTSSPCFVKAIVFAVFLILIPSGGGERREEVCPVVLPELPSEDPSEGRIVNGDIAAELRSYVGALTSFGDLFCTASLLSEFWALTAAHCPVSPGFTKFVTGGTTFDEGVEIEIESKIVHTGYPTILQDENINDIQLIELKTPAPPTAKFVKLNTESSIPAPDSFVRVAGFGKTRGTAFPLVGVLRQVDLPVQPTRICEKQYVGVAGIFQEHHICAGYEEGGCDSCQGDSGGPVFIFDEDLNLIQVGIVSFGLDCALPNSAGVNTRVSSHIDWLRRSGAAFQTSSSGVEYFIDPETGVPVTNPADVVSSNVSSANEAEMTPGPVAAEIPGENETEASGSTEPSVSPIVIAGILEVNASSSPPSAECFPGSASVALEDGTTKQMKDLEIGDSVQVGRSRFSKVFMFTHRISHGTYKFVKLTNSYSEDALLVTRGHVLPINGVYKPAGMARAGDVVELGDGRKAEIVLVEDVFEGGLYNPQTIDGRVVVNDVVASTYTTALEINTAHAVLAPLRFVSMVSGWDVSGGVLEDGVPLLGTL